MSRNDDTRVQDDGVEHVGYLSIFKYPGQPFGKAKSRYMTNEEYKAARSYILLNCSEVEPYIRIYRDSLKQSHPTINDMEVDKKLENEFPDWFNTHVHAPSNEVDNMFIKDLAKGPLRSVRSFHGYYANGYRFHTLQHGLKKATSNSGVCIRGSNLSSSESDYYGSLIEVIELEYPALPIKRTVLFKCDWFYPTHNIGTKVHKEYKLVEVNHQQKLNRYEPFCVSCTGKSGVLL